jgi:hypothetical protein
MSLAFATRARRARVLAAVLGFAAPAGGCTADSGGLAGIAVEAGAPAPTGGAGGAPSGSMEAGAPAGAGGAGGADAARDLQPALPDVGGSVTADVAIAADLAAAPDLPAEAPADRPVLCRPGEFHCEGVVLQACSADGAAFVPVRTCVSAALCKEATGECLPPACALGFQCKGDALQKCNAERTAWEPVRTCGPGLCDAMIGACLQCARNARTCASETTVQICAADGQHATTQPCAGMAPYCRDGACTACKAGGACGDGLCPACESIAACAADCGPLVFQGREARRSNTGDWARDSFKSECGAYQAVRGLSLITSSSQAHAILCTGDDPSHPHGAASGCHAVDFSMASVGWSTDWDVFHYKGECAANEFVAGVAQTPAGALTHILCCPGTVRKQSCAAVVMDGKDDREAGAVAASGDWDPFFYKGECGPGRYVAGVSRTVAASATTIAGAGHALYCCGK